MTNCTVCAKPALPGYSTCGNSYCQQIETYRNRLRNMRSRVKCAQLAAEIKMLEDQAFTPK
jgi:predicted nucleic acid-binding Zn ribbon protein